MVYIIHKKTSYQDIGHQRIDVGLYYVEEKYIQNTKDYVLFGTRCCKEYVEENVFFDDKIGAYTECSRRNKEAVDLILELLKEIDMSYKERKNYG